MKKEQSIFSTMKTFALSHSTIVFLIFLLTFNCIITPNFINATTLWNLIVQTTPLLLVALGMTFVISSGGINIAVGSLMAVAGMLVVRLMEVTSIGIALAITIFTITLVGGVIGFVIVRFDIQPIIITLAFLIGARGIARMLGYGSVLHYDSAEFGMLTLTRIKNVPIQLIYVIVFAAIFIFIAKKTTFARYVEAIGDNRNASLLAGIRVNESLIAVYALSGLMAALAGILTVSRAGAADPKTVGNSLEMYAIAAVAIGDTKMSGGKAKVVGSIIGACIMQLITITINMNNIAYEWSLTISTIVIIGAVVLQNIKGE